MQRRTWILIAVLAVVLLLAVAGCQQEMGNRAGAKRTLESLVSKYPTSPAAESARQKLKKK